MKKIALVLFLVSFITSCGNPGRVCGGSSGKRCVEITKKSLPQTHSELKRNS